MIFRLISRLVLLTNACTLESFSPCQLCRCLLANTARRHESCLSHASSKTNRHNAMRNIMLPSVWLSVAKSFTRSAKTHPTTCSKEVFALAAWSSIDRRTCRANRCRSNHRCWVRDIRFSDGVFNVKVMISGQIVPKKYYGEQA